jgi:uncharacterized protein
MTPEQKLATENCILKVVVGSNLYGTTTENSDIDRVGTFIPPVEYLLGFKRIEVVQFNKKSKDEAGKNTKEAIDCTFYTLQKFCRLALDNNPNILEVLFVPKDKIEYTTKQGEYLLSLKYHFLSRNVKHRFLGYAYSQKNKMIIKLSTYDLLNEARDYLETREEKFLNETPQHPLFQRVKDKSFFKVGDINIPANCNITKAKNILDRRLQKFSNRRELIERYGYDTKFASHLIRLLLEGKELLSTGDLKFPLSYAKLILDIKQGKYNIKEIIELAEELEAEVEEAYNKNKLIEKPGHERIEEFLVETHLAKVKGLI